MSWLKSRLGRLFIGTAEALEAGIGLGLISGAALTFAVGQVVLGGIMAALAVGIYLRFKRKKIKRKNN
jgi:O-antigen/teichoic acid export membrane protein